MADPTRIGVIGCGAISGAYLGMAKNFPSVQIAAVADLNREAAEKRAAEFQIPTVLGVDELIADKSIDIVLNLTIPKAHAPIAIAALEAGKHTYCEKPFGINRAEGQKVLDLAKEKNLRVGCAPDTFMGAGVQTARKVIDDGIIGRPVGFTALMMGRGHETWHPSPEFYYEPGGGPMFDMGPYYLTALINLLGPIKRLSGATSIAIPERTITSKPKFGKKITVTTPDHYVGTIEFQNGAIGTMVMSFAIMHTQQNWKQPIAIFGTEGTILVPDPNGFDGQVAVKIGNDQDWRDIPHQFVTGYGRSVGLADMASAVKTGRPFRPNGELAFAVLDAMQGFLDSSESGRFHIPSVKVERPAPMRADLPFGTLDE
jgi:predicted dehydrogenase